MAIEDLGLIVASITGFSIVAFAIWNASKKVAQVEQTQEEQDRNQTKDIVDINERITRELTLVEKKHLADVKALESEIQRQIVERQGDISNNALEVKEDFNNIQKQIDSARGDIKNLLSKIEVNETKIKGSDEIHTELKTKIDKHQSDLLSIVHDQIDFIADWNQRIEDRIEALRREMHTMLFEYKKNGNGNSH